jgi:hypothetical protein
VISSPFEVSPSRDQIIAPPRLRCEMYWALRFISIGSSQVQKVVPSNSQAWPALASRCTVKVLALVFRIR